MEDVLEKEVAAEEEVPQVEEVFIIHDAVELEKELQLWIQLMLIPMLSKM